MVIGTHNGIFHTDEIAAIAMLKNKWNEIEVVRSRDPKELEICDILVDVGGEYDGVRKFDHHHFTEGDALYGKSSAGLVADALNLKGFDSLVKAIDARDTRVGYQRGMEYDDLFNLVNDCNLLDISSPEQDNRFMELVELFAAFFGSQITYDVLYELVAKIAEANKAQKDAIMKKRHEEKEAIGEIDGIPVYAHPEKLHLDTKLFGDEPYVVVEWDSLQNCNSVTCNTDYCKIVEVPNPIFIHPNRFIAKFKGDYTLGDIKIEKVEK